MNSLKKILQLAGVFISSITLVLAGPGGHLQLVNMSPYNWKLTYQHSYHSKLIFVLTSKARGCLRS